MTKESSVDDASTSTASTDDSALDNTMKILESLVIDWQAKSSSDTKSPGRKNLNKEEETNETRSQSVWRRRVKWNPYSIPRKQPVTQAADDLFFEMSRIQFPEDVDVEILRLCLLDRRDIPVACSVQAARPPTPDGEVDELSEYFAHFVRVDLKMSSLAESMYV
ncbi:hypothetical protein Q1695_010019 [Nippostrongylus brasiliensis]|nr:hypothetical protein Q1695_010019 [Nippostrongylus brasiliensis]